MRPLSCLVVAVWLLSVPATAQPAPLPLELSWQAPSECPAASDVHAELARIASAAEGEDLRPLTAGVEVARDAGRYTARLRTAHEGLIGERTLQADDCATLTRSITLVLALAFGRGVQLRETAEAAGAQTAPAQPTSPPAATEAPTAAAKQDPQQAKAEREDEEAEQDDSGSTSPVRFGALLGGGAQLTLMPRVAPLLTAGATLELSAISLELRASFMPGTSETIDARIGARAVVDGLAATALACARGALVDFCAGARGGAIRARSRSLFETGDRTAPWYALAFAAGLRWPEDSALQVSLEALLAISLTRPRYEVTGYGVAHRVPLLAPELSAFLRFAP